MKTIERPKKSIWLELTESEAILVGYMLFCHETGGATFEALPSKIKAKVNALDDRGEVPARYVGDGSW